jgi:glycosyltransferase involved in cell wall biosynthesis
MQFRGAETFAQHLEVALRSRYDFRLFTLFGGGSASRAELAIAAVPPLEVDDANVPPGASRLRSSRGLRRRVEGFDPQIIVAHGGEPLVAATLGGLHKWAPVVYVRVAGSPERSRRGARGWMLHTAYARASALVAVDELLREELAGEFGIDAERIRVIENGRPRMAPLSSEERARLRAKAGVPDAGPMIVWAGEFVPEKNPLEAIRAASRLASMSSPAHLSMIGDGRLMPQALREAAGLKNVHLIGRQAGASALIAAADVLCSTSIAEGTPGVVIEALLAGVPVVAPRVGGIPAAVPAEAGLLVDGDHLEEIAPSIASILADHAFRARLSAGARSAGERFEISAVARKYDDLYAELAGRRPPPHPAQR